MGQGAVYLDYNATAPVRPAAAAAVAAALAVPGNPSSIHGFGRAARRLLEDARDSVAGLVGASPRGVIFTSGGTEANALALNGFSGRSVIVSAVEHVSVLVAAPSPVVVPVDGQGVVDLAALEQALATAEPPVLLSLMLANNETGVIQPVAEAAAIARAHGAVVHCDAIQAAGRIDVDMTALRVDALSLSAHKLGGPKGVGALVLAEPEAGLAPLLRGGGQERRRRAGTENVAGAAGFAAAAVEALAGLNDGGRMAAMRDRLEREACRRVPGVVRCGAGAGRLPNTSCLAVPGLSAQTLLMGLDLDGIAVSSGAACSSGKVAASHVLTAMGLGALAGSAIRISLGWATTEGDLDRFVEAYARLCQNAGSGRTAPLAV